MAPINPEILAERIKVIQREIREIKAEIKTLENDFEKVGIIVHRLESVEKNLGSMSKDAGWRGFFLDFIKAAAQIAALVGAGKFIF